MPASMWRLVFSRTTIASSTTKPVATVSAIRLRLFEAEAEQVHHAERAEQRGDRRHRRHERRAHAAQEQADDQHDQDHRDDQRDLDLVQRRADRDACGRRRRASSTSAGSSACSSGSSARTRVDGLDDVRAPAGCVISTMIAGSPLKRPERVRVLDAVDHIGDVLRAAPRRRCATRRPSARSRAARSAGVCV